MLVRTLGALFRSFEQLGCQPTPSPAVKEIDDELIQKLGIPGIIENVTSFGCGFVQETCIVKKFFLPKKFKRNLLVAGRWGVIIPLAGYNYHHIMYEPDSLQKELHYEAGCNRQSVDHIPASAQPFDGLKLFGVRGDCKLFVTDKEIRWRSKDGRLSDGFPNPLGEHYATMHLHGMCKYGLVCISSDDDLLLLFSTEQPEGRLVQKIKGLQCMAINRDGNLLAYSTSNDPVVTVCSVDLTGKTIQLKSISSTIDAKAPVVGLRFTDNLNLLVARKDMGEADNDAKATQNIFNLNGTRKGLHEDIIEWYQVTGREQTVLLKMEKEVRLLGSIVNRNAYFGDESFIQDIGSIETPSVGCGHTKDCALHPGNEPRDSITIRPYIGNTHLLELRVEPSQCIDMTKCNSVVSPTMGHMVAYRRPPTVKSRMRPDRLVYIIGLRRHHKIYQDHLISRAHASSLARLRSESKRMKKPQVWPLQTKNQVVNTLSQFTDPHQFLEGFIYLGNALQRAQKSSNYHMHEVVKRYSNNAHLVREFSIHGIERQVKHMAMARLGFHLPIEGFETRFFSYQRGNPMASQVYVEALDRLNSIPDLLAFDVCSDYHLFITHDAITVRRRKGQPISFANPLGEIKEARGLYELGISRMTPSGLVCLYDNLANLVVLDITTQKSCVVQGPDLKQLPDLKRTRWATMNKKGTLVAYLRHKQVVLLKVSREGGQITVSESSSHDLSYSQQQGDQIHFIYGRHILVEHPKWSTNPEQFQVDQENILVPVEDSSGTTPHHDSVPVYPKSQAGMPKFTIRVGRVEWGSSELTLTSLMRGKIGQINFSVDESENASYYASPLGTHLVVHHRISGMVRVYGLLDNYPAVEERVITEIRTQNNPLWFLKPNRQKSKSKLESWQGFPMCVDGDGWRLVKTHFMQDNPK